MKKILIVLYCCLIFNAYGQKAFVGILYQRHISEPHIPKGTTINGERYFIEDSLRFINPRSGYTVQGSYIYSISKYFRIQSGLSFSKYSTRIVYLSFTPPPNGKFYSSLVHTLTYKFVNIPIIVNGIFPINNTFRFLVACFGVFVGSSNLIGTVMTIVIFKSHLLTMKTGADMKKNTIRI